MSFSEFRRELHMSVVPVGGWLSGGKFVQMSPAALWEFFTGLFKPKKEETDEERMTRLFNGCTVSCPTSDEQDIHEHVLTFDEVIALANSRTRLDMSKDELQEILDEVLLAVHE